MVSFPSVEEELCTFTGQNNDSATKVPNVFVDSFNTKNNCERKRPSAEIACKIM